MLNKAKRCSVRSKTLLSVLHNHTGVSTLHSNASSSHQIKFSHSKVDELRSLKPTEMLFSSDVKGKKRKRTIVFRCNSSSLTFFNGKKSFINIFKLDKT